MNNSMIFIQMKYYFSALCYEANILTRENAQFKANDETFELSRAYLNMRGVKFSSFQPNVTIIFNSDDVIVTKMYAQVDPPAYPSNIAQICVNLLDRTGARLTYPNKTIIPTLISPINSPVIEGWFEGVKTIQIRLCNTTDKKEPNGFRFAVVGCYASIATFIIPQTKTTIAPRMY